MKNCALVLNSFSELHTKSFDALKGISKHNRIWGVAPLVPVQAGNSQRGGPTTMSSDKSDQFHNKKLIVDEVRAAIPVCEGLGTIPDSVKLARILADSLQLNCPERIVWMRMRDKALNAAEQGGSSCKALDDSATHISDLIP
ncbi:hypothetical protein Ddye_023731 [Dipteronia dyeriana]|uniref:Uncharacterized protein n=1 Tax=Dipteronia dyeriana TaxID=168575 RepID=A0AAD9TU47_9ROSI|nr:hypothetical protein Ddye_023731 [Dipteronia dyeriana]